jgi:DNA-binding protein HU-beta
MRPRAHRVLTAPRLVRAGDSVCPGLFNPLFRFTHPPWRKPVALTQAQLAAAVAERAELSKADAKRALAALDEIVLEELGNAQKVRIGGLVQLTVRVKPAQKARMGRNPATGEEIKIAAKPASVDLRARPLAKAKAGLPSVQKARRRLAAA